MAAARTLSTLAFFALATAACQPATSTSPIVLTPGTTEYQLRQEQLRNAQQDPTRAMQNPVATGTSPGTTGIERAPSGGTGGVGAGAPVEVNPGVSGIARAPGTGAPMR